MSTAVLVAWTFTYLAHSTVLIAGAWLLERSGILRSLGAREWLWRAALLGGVVSASVQSFGEVRPWTGSAPLPHGVESIDRVAARPIPSLAGPSPAGWGATRLSTEGAPMGRIGERESRPAAVPLAARLRDLAPQLGVGLLGLWLIGLSLRAYVALGRRRPVRAGVWADELTGLIRDARLVRRVRLTSSRRLVAPVALGVLRPEICLPARALGEERAHLARPALAHELAHLVRFDPLWLGVAYVARSLLFVQPLNHLAARRLAHLAELSADEWAVRRTGDRIALARCLTEVAGWLRPIGPPLGTCAMVRRRGRLEERVRRLLDERPEGGARRAPALAALAVLAVAPLALPGWSASAPSPADPAARAGAARTWNAAARTIELLEDQLAAIEERLSAFPPSRPVPADLIERLRALRAVLSYLDATVDREIDPGGHR